MSRSVCREVRLHDQDELDYVNSAHALWDSRSHYYVFAQARSD